LIKFDLNADMGEEMGDDAALMPLVSSASIACGGHAGDAATMRATLRLAARHGVAAGAHPGFADRANFGRMRLQRTPAELTAEVRAQVARLLDIAEDESIPVRYVKLHGALANMAAEDEAVARAAFEGAALVDRSLAVLALDNSAQVAAAENLGLRVAREAYADRAIDDHGLLVPRGTPGAVLEDAGKAVDQCLGLARRGELTTLSGNVLASAARSICIHGDTPGAVAMARRIRAALLEAGVSITAPW